MAAIYTGTGRTESFCREFYGTYIMNIFSAKVKSSVIKNNI